jgi:hypothetical protein
MHLIWHNFYLRTEKYCGKTYKPARLNRKGEKMEYKSLYVKRKKLNNVFLEAQIEPDFADDLGKIVPIQHVNYKIVYRNNEYGKVIVKMDIYNTDNYSLSIKSMYCRGYVKNDSEFGEGIYSESLREFWRYLKNFEYDLKERLEDMLLVHSDEINERCRKLLQEILNEL